MASCIVRPLNPEVSTNFLYKEDLLQAFESLKACRAKLDHSPQNFKASVGRSGTHGQRRPPSRCSRANSIISSKSSTNSIECIDIDKETTLIPHKVVHIEVRLENSEQVATTLKESCEKIESNTKFEVKSSNTKCESETPNYRVKLEELSTIVGSNEIKSNFKHKESHQNFDLPLPSISPILHRLLRNSKVNGKKYKHIGCNILSLSSLIGPTLKKSESSSSLSAIDFNRHHQHHSKTSNNDDDFADSQSHFSDSCLTSSVLIRNILNGFKSNYPHRDSSSDTEVVISDRESISDSGEVNRRTIIHITERNKPDLNIPKLTDKNNNLKGDPRSHLKLYENKKDLSVIHTGFDKPLSHVGIEPNVYERKSRMFVRQSDSSNRPSRASAFNVRQTIEKRQIQQERRERRLLRKKVKEHQRSYSVGREDTDSSSFSLCSSEESNISKSLSSLDDNVENNSVDPLTNAQSNSTLESDKTPARTYLFGTNLPIDSNNITTPENIVKRVRGTSRKKQIDTDKENIIKRVRHNFGEKQIDTDKENIIQQIRGNSVEKQIDTGKENYNLSCKNLSREVTEENQSLSKTSLPINHIYQTESYINSKLQYNDITELKPIKRTISRKSVLDNITNTVNVTSEVYSPTPPPRRRSRLSSSVGQLTVDKIQNPNWLRQAKERRSLRIERNPFEELSEKRDYMVASEPEWVGKARKKLESMNVILTSTTDTVSVSSVISDSSAWSRGGLDALEDLKEEVGRMSDVLSEEALQKVESELGITYRDKNMIEYPSIPEHPNEQQNYPLTSNESFEKDEVRFGDLKHDWGGMKYEHKVNPNSTRFSANLLGKENVNKRRNQNTSNKYEPTINVEKKTPKVEKIKLMHFGDIPQDLMSKQSLNIANQKSSKFESISGPDPLTMSAEQLNQNVEEYDFPVPTGNEDSRTLLKMLELSLKKTEIVPEFTSDIENEPKPKSILKRRSNQSKNSLPDFVSEDHALDRSKKKHNSTTEKYRTSKHTNSNDQRYYPCETFPKIDNSHKQDIPANCFKTDRSKQLDRKYAKSQNVQPIPLKSPTTISNMHDTVNKGDTKYSKINYNKNINNLSIQNHGLSKNMNNENNCSDVKKMDDTKYTLEQTLKNNHINVALSEWEQLQRQRLDNEEKDKVNRGTFTRPVSDKIKDLVRLHGGIMNVFTKDKKSHYNGTVDAKEILFQKIPSPDVNQITNENYRKLSGTDRIRMKSIPIVNSPAKLPQTNKPTYMDTQGKLRDLDNTFESGISQSNPHTKPISTYHYSLPETYSTTVSFDRCEPKNKNLVTYGKSTLEITSNNTTTSLLQTPNSFTNKNTEHLIKVTIPPIYTNGDKANPLSIGNRNSTYRSSYPEYKSGLSRINDYTRTNEDIREINYNTGNRLDNNERSSNLDTWEGTKTSSNNSYRKNSTPRSRSVQSNLNPIPRQKLCCEKDSSKENVCPNIKNCKSDSILSKYGKKEHFNSLHDSFTESAISPRGILDRFGSERRSMTRVQNMRDINYSPFERSRSPVALSDKSYIVDRNRLGSPFSTLSMSSRDRRYSLRSAPSPRSTPDREGPVSLSSILSRDTCSPYSSSSRLSTTDELGNSLTRYRRDVVDRESSIFTNDSENDKIPMYLEPQHNSRKPKNHQNVSTNRKSSDYVSANGKNLSLNTSNKHRSSHQTSRKTPPRSLDRRSRMIDSSSRLQRKDSYKSKDRRNSKKSIDKLSTPKSSVAVKKKEKWKRFNSGVSTRNEREDESEYYENINIHSGEGWSKTMIRKTKLGKPVRENTSLSRENSGSSTNSRHIKNASADLEKWAAQSKTSGKLVKKEGQRYSHEVEEEEKEGIKSAKAVSRKVVRRGSRRMSKGGEIISETKEIAKDVPSKPPKALHRSNDQFPKTSLVSYVPKDDVTRKLKTKTDGERFMTTSVQTVKGINTMTTQEVDNKKTQFKEVIGGKGWEGEREVDGIHGERVIVRRHIGKGVRSSTVIKKASSNSKIITTKTKMRPVHVCV